MRSDEAAGLFGSAADHTGCAPMHSTTTFGAGKEGEFTARTLTLPLLSANWTRSISPALTAGWKLNSAAWRVLMTVIGKEPLKAVCDWSSPITRSCCEVRIALLASCSAGCGELVLQCRWAPRSRHFTSVIQRRNSGPVFAYLNARPVGTSALMHSRSERNVVTAHAQR